MAEYKIHYTQQTDCHVWVKARDEEHLMEMWDDGEIWQTLDFGSKDGEYEEHITSSKNVNYGCIGAEILSIEEEK